MHLDFESSDEPLLSQRLIHKRFTWLLFITKNIRIKKMKVSALLTVAFAQESSEVSRLRAQIEQFKNFTTDDGAVRSPGSPRYFGLNLGIENRLKLKLFIIPE